MLKKSKDEEKIVFDIEAKKEQTENAEVNEDMAEEENKQPLTSGTQETLGIADKAVAKPEEKSEPAGGGEKKAKKKRRKKKKKGLWVLLVLAALVIGGIVMSKTGKKDTSVMVVTEEVKTGEIVQNVELSGTVESEETKVYFSKVSAPITELNVTAGQTVRAGQRLVSFDTTDMENNIKQAELDTEISKIGADATIAALGNAQGKAAQAAKNYDEAKQYVAHYTECVAQYGELLEKATDMEEQKAEAEAEAAKCMEALKADPEDKDSKKKLKKLSDKIENLEKKLKEMDVKNIKKQYEICTGDLEAYKALQSQYEAQKEVDVTAPLQKKQQSLVKESAEFSKELSEAKLEVAKQGVTADFDGIVTMVGAVCGQTAMEGGELFTVANADKVKVSLEVSKYDIEKVKLGQKAVVTINGNEYEGEVSKISRIATTNAAGGIAVATEVHILNPDDNIVLGVEGKVKIETARVEDTVLLPALCVNYASEGTFCYVVRDGVVKKADVELGISDDENMQVLSGLKAGDKVLTDSLKAVEEGTIVTETDEETLEKAKSGLAMLAQ